MLADVMQKISIQDGPMTKPREETKEKNAFSEILSSTMNRKSGNKKEMDVKEAVDPKEMEGTLGTAVGLKETKEIPEAAVRMKETKEILEATVSTKEVEGTRKTAMGMIETEEIPESTVRTKKMAEIPEAAVRTKEMEETPGEAVKMEEAVVGMNLFPEMKTESPMYRTAKEGKASSESVEETKSAVDKPQDEKNPLSGLMGRKRNELLSLKELTNEKDPRIIEIPKDQGKIVSDENELVKAAAAEKPERFMEVFKHAIPDEKSLTKEGVKLPVEKVVSEKLQAAVPKEENTAKDELKVAASTGKDPALKLDTTEETKEVKSFKEVYQAMEGKETVKEVKTATDDLKKMEESIVPMNETKVTSHLAAPEKVSPKSIDFEKTFDNATAEIMKSMETIKEGDKTTMKVNLHPEELGKMEITLTMEDGKLSGKILLDNREIRQIFTERLEELSNALKSSSIQIGKFEVGVGDRGEENQGRQQGKQQMQNPFRGYFNRKSENSVYPVSPERDLKEINLLA